MVSDELEVEYRNRFIKNLNPHQEILETLKIVLEKLDKLAVLHEAAQNNITTTEEK